MLVDSVEAAAALFNRYSPQFAASLISADPAAHELFYGAVNAPFVGDGFTRWVDGQFALDRPELGLSNWEHGRLFARGGVLSGDGVFTVRARVRQSDPNLDRNVKFPDHVEKGFTWLLGQQKEDGGIYNRGLSVYNTATSVTGAAQVSRAGWRAAPRPPARGATAAQKRESSGSGSVAPALTRPATSSVLVDTTPT